MPYGRTILGILIVTDAFCVAATALLLRLGTPLETSQFIVLVLLGLSTVLVFKERNRVVPHLEKKFSRARMVIASIAVAAILVASFFLGYYRHHA